MTQISLSPPQDQGGVDSLPIYTIKTESYIGEIPTFRLSWSTHFNNVISAALFANANQVRFIICETNGLKRDDSRIKSSFMLSGCCFSDLYSPICSASIAQLMNIGTFAELGSVPRLTSLNLGISVLSALYDS